MVDCSVVNAAFNEDMDPSMFVAYTPQANGVPLESKLATYMVLFFFYFFFLLLAILLFSLYCNL
jgi:hypothetical protein